MQTPYPSRSQDRGGQTRAAGGRVLLFGATGTIGRATLRALLRRGYEVVCFVRPDAGLGGRIEAGKLPGCTVRIGQIVEPASVIEKGFAGEPFDAVVSCMASRNGTPRDAWAVDYQAHLNILSAAQAHRVAHFVLLSAICVQKPLLEFQRAKLAFEKRLTDSGLPFTIVRPTAFFKSLSGQVERVKRGKSFLLFGDGALTACKPISDGDLAEYLTDCLEDRTRLGRVLPIGGPGCAITPRQQGEYLFQLLKRPPIFRRVPLGLLDGIIAVLGTAGRALPAIAVKAELARIGRYYATESMLVLDPHTGQYDAELTPSTGSETLFDHYARLVSGEAARERGDHAVF